MFICVLAGILQSAKYLDNLVTKYPMNGYLYYYLKFYVWCNVSDIEMNINSLALVDLNEILNY